MYIFNVNQLFHFMVLLAFLNLLEKVLLLGEVIPNKKEHNNS